LAASDGDLVELQPLLFNAAEDHRAQTAIADGERFFPFGGGTFIPDVGGLRIGGGFRTGGEQSGADRGCRQLKEGSSSSKPLTCQA
jgi:hypothetical protein